MPYAHPMQPKCDDAWRKVLWAMHADMGICAEHSTARSDVRRAREMLDRVVDRERWHMTAKEMRDAVLAEFKAESA